MILKKAKNMVSKTPVKKTIDTPKVETPAPENTSAPQQVIRPDTIHHEGDTMKDLFFIVKGQYRKGIAPSFVNSVTGDVNYVGGYDPDKDTTEKWYMCLDKVTFQCVSCGSDFNKVVHSVYTLIMKYKGNAKKYFKHISDTTSDDYYETHYLGHAPLTLDQRNKKAEGRCPRVSPPMRCLYNAVYSWYGDYFSEQVREMEDQAYSDLEEVIRNSKPINRTKRIMKKTPVKKVEMEETSTPKVSPNTMKKVVKPKLGLKKLK